MTKQTLDLQVCNHINEDDGALYSASVWHGGIVVVGGDPTSEDVFCLVTSVGPDTINACVYLGNQAYQQGRALVSRVLSVNNGAISQVATLAAEVEKLLTSCAE